MQIKAARMCCHSGDLMSLEATWLPSRALLDDADVLAISKSAHAANVGGHASEGNSRRRLNELHAFTNFKELKDAHACDDRLSCSVVKKLMAVHMAV